MATKLDLPLVVITGPTASGKSGIAIELAGLYDGEIICADSRTIYKGMDIGTAKPSKQDQALVPHWGLDIVTPDQAFTAADFKRYALQKIEEIRSRGHVPFLVGGTGLYIDSIIFDYQFGPVADPEEREKLEHMSLDELHKYCIQHNIILPENSKNKRYVMRAIEQKGISSMRSDTPVENTIIVGIATDRDELRIRIKRRSEQLFEDGVVDEAKSLGDMYGWGSEAMTGNIYRLVNAYLRKEITQSELETKNEITDWRLAKRQIVWLKRNPFITWLPLSEVENFVANHLG